MDMQEKVEQYYSSFGKARNAGMYISGIFVFVMMIYTCLDVIFRNVQGFSPLYAYEISQSYFMPLMVFPGMAYAFGSGIMPKIDLVLEKFSIKVQKLVNIGLFLFECILLSMLIVFGTQYMIHSIATAQSFTAGGMNFLLWPVILFVPLGMLLTLIEVIFQLLKTIYK